MTLSSLSSQQLNHLIKLVGEKEKLQNQIAKIDREVDNLDGRTSSLARGAAKSPNVKRSRKRRNSLKADLLAKLQDAGKGGMTTHDLAAALGAKPASIYAWFYTTGKKVKGIKKVGKAKFAYLLK